MPKRMPLAQAMTASVPWREAALQGPPYADHH